MTDDAPPRLARRPLRAPGLLAPALGVLLLAAGSAAAVARLASDGPRARAAPGAESVAAVAPDGAPEPPTSPTGAGAGEGLLARAREAVRRNDPDVPGASRDGLVRAELELRAALRLQGSDRLPLQRGLAEVCAALAREWAATPEEKLRPLACEREARREVAELAPGDGQARHAWAMLMEDRAARVRALEDAVQLAPGDPHPRRALGEDLMVLGRVEEGARRLVEAAERYRPDELAEHGRDILYLLRANGREEEEQRVREDLERLGP